MVELLPTRSKGVVNGLGEEAQAVTFKIGFVLAPASPCETDLPRLIL